MDKIEISKKLEEPATSMLQLTISLLNEIISSYDSDDGLEKTANELEHLCESIGALASSMKAYATYLREQPLEGGDKRDFYNL